MICDIYYKINIKNKNYIQLSENNYRNLYIFERKF